MVLANALLRDGREWQERRLGLLLLKTAPGGGPIGSPILCGQTCGMPLIKCPDDKKEIQTASRFETWMLI